MACNYNKIEYPLSKISDLEKLRVDIIDALNEVGVACDASTSFHDLPDYILKIGGTDTSNWPLDLSSIGYTAEDCRRASYRYMLSFMLNSNNKRDYLNLSNLIYSALTVELPKSIEKANYWNSLTSEQKATKDSMFNEWDGAFCPYIDTTDARTFNNWFLRASKLVHIPTLNTTNVTSAGGMFAFNTVCLHEWPEFDMRNVTECESIYYSGSGNAYICGLKNLGRDPSTGEIHQMGSIYAVLMFFAIYAGAWWNPCHGGIIVYPMWFYKPRRTGVSAGYNMNILSCDALYYYDADVNLSGSNFISYNTLYNIITSIVDVTNTPDVTWNPNFIIDSSLHNNTDVWDPAFDSMLEAKGWALNIIN